MRYFFISQCVLLFLTLNTYGQILNFKEKFELPSIVKETSGLLLVDGKIITHNDRGNAANLYEIDSLTGKLLRAIAIKNATNADWEDLAEDETHIYIGDFGNNNGTRRDLKVYKISKSDFKEKNNVNAQLISFHYEDQVSFNSSNNHNFDAEAFVIYQNSIFIFTKNRGDFETNVYKIPSSIGSHKAIKVSNANIGGLITGATEKDDNFILCGYDDEIPFIIHIGSHRKPGDDFFSDGFKRFSLGSELEQGSQVEGITSFGDHKFYISREEVDNRFGKLPQKLYEYTDFNNNLLSIEKNNLESISVYPNPSFGKIHINTNSQLKSVLVFNVLGNKILQKNNSEKVIDISLLSKGIYILRITLENNTIFTKKIIKN